MNTGNSCRNCRYFGQKKRKWFGKFYYCSRNSHCSNGRIIYEKIRKTDVCEHFASKVAREGEKTPVGKH